MRLQALAAVSGLGDRHAAHLRRGNQRACGRLRWRPRSAPDPPAGSPSSRRACRPRARRASPDRARVRCAPPGSRSQFSMPEAVDPRRAGSVGSRKRTRPAQRIAEAGTAGVHTPTMPILKADCAHHRAVEREPAVLAHHVGREPRNRAVDRTRFSRSIPKSTQDCRPPSRHSRWRSSASSSDRAANRYRAGTRAAPP